MCSLQGSYLSLPVTRFLFFFNGTHGLGKSMKKDTKKIFVCGKSALEFLRLLLSTEF